MQMPPVLAAVSGRLSQIGFERTRRALAALALSVFVTLYFLVSLNAPDGFARVFLALSLCYGVAFVGVAAEWFWGRWFATGLAWSGIMLAVAVLVMMGWMPQMAIFGGIHLIVALALAGKKMADRYDGQEAWRTKYKMDDFGVARLQKTITRAAASLPSLIIWALAPKEEGMAFAIGGFAALALAAFGLRGLVKMRSWGVVSLAGAAAVAAAFSTMTTTFLPSCHDMTEAVAPSPVPGKRPLRGGPAGRGGAAVRGLDRPLPAPARLAPLRSGARPAAAADQAGPEHGGAADERHGPAASCPRVRGAPRAPRWRRARVA